MHILQIYKDYDPVFGGIENHVRDLSELLAVRGHRVTVLVTSLEKKTHIEYPAPNLTVVKAARLVHAASTPISPAMLSFARNLRPNIVHLHFPYPPGDLVARAVAGTPPLVVTYHSDIVRQKNLLRVYQPLLEATLRRASRIIATSSPYIESSPWLSRYAEKCVVVPLGIDVERWSDGGQSAKRKAQSERAIRSLQRTTNNGQRTTDNGQILFVGRLRYYKGLHVLLNAIPHVHATLLVAGSGPERERLEAQATTLGISDRVCFLGDVADAALPALYRTADLFVLPAHLRAEAFGIAQLEAMASGLPCISTELGTGTSFANQHGETGLVVPSGDPNALATAINTLMANPELRRRYGENAQRRARALFSRERMADDVERVYREVLRTED